MEDVRASSKKSSQKMASCGSLVGSESFSMPYVDGIKSPLERDKALAILVAVISVLQLVLYSLRKAVVVLRSGR